MDWRVEFLTYFSLLLQPRILRWQSIRSTKNERAYANNDRFDHSTIEVGQSTKLTATIFNTEKTREPKSSSVFFGRSFCFVSQFRQLGEAKQRKYSSCLETLVNCHTMSSKILEQLVANFGLCSLGQTFHPPAPNVSSSWARVLLDPA